MHLGERRGVRDTTSASVYSKNFVNFFLNCDTFLGDPSVVWVSWRLAQLWWKINENEEAPYCVVCWKVQAAKATLYQQSM